AARRSHHRNTSPRLMRFAGSRACRPRRYLPPRTTTARRSTGTAGLWSAWSFLLLNARLLDGTAQMRHFMTSGSSALPSGIVAWSDHAWVWERFLDAGLNDT